MNKLKSVLENDMHEILWNFELQTDHFIPARRVNVVIIEEKKRKEKKNMASNGFYPSGGPQSRNKRKGKDIQKLGPGNRTEKNYGT